MAASATFEGFATGTILVAAIAVLGSLTVLSAALSKLGDGVEKGRVHVIGRLKRSGRESRLWGAVIDRVMRRPLLLVFQDHGESLLGFESNGAITWWLPKWLDWLPRVSHAEPGTEAARA